MKVFDSVRVGAPRRNKFDLSHERKMTLDMGKLYPILCQEVLPGDVWRVRSEVFLRAMALLAPVMHRVDVTVHYFFVPNRLIWKNFPDFITGGEDGLQAPVPPKWRVTDAITAGCIRNGGLLDYLGFPTVDAGGSEHGFYSNHTFSALPLRAYQLIYDQYYRDQNVEESWIDQINENPDKFDDDGTVSLATLQALGAIRTRAWEKDYLTSCLPWTQRGAAVNIPITSNVNYRDITKIKKSSDDTDVTAAGLQAAAGNLRPTASAEDLYVDNIESITSANFTVNALRTSLRLQEWYEKNARGGGRYIEQLASHFGVVSSDARLQRAEYLGGGKQPVVISEVLQTAPNPNIEDVTPLGTMAGHGMSVGGTNSFTKFFEEHGFVMGILSVTPRTSYQQGYQKMWSRVSLTDYYFPEFANLGEQAVYGGEAYYQVKDGSAEAQARFASVFGYQSRYAEYKYIPSWVSGEMRDSLAYWHFGRIFSSGAGVPQLNADFVQCNPRKDAFAIQGLANNWLCQIFHRIDALRPIPYHSTPSI